MHSNIKKCFQKILHNKKSITTYSITKYSSEAGFLKLPNLHMLLKQDNPSLPRNLVLGTFG